MVLPHDLSAELVALAISILMVAGVAWIVPLFQSIRRSEEKIEHLNLVLRAIRGVNQLITKETDRDRLLWSACQKLAEMRGYHSAWVALLDESEKLVTYAEAGLGENFLPLIELLKHGKLIACGRQALKQSEAVTTQAPFSNCADCPLAITCVVGGAMTIRLEHGGKVYGLLSVSIPIKFIANEEEQGLYKEVAGDIAFALHNMKIEAERQQMETQIARSSRLSAMGEMIGGVAHELNNPLTSVLGNAQLLMSSKFDKKTISETLGKIESSAKRCRDIVADLLEFTREKSYRFKLININDVIKNVSKMFQEQADISHIKIRTNYEQDLPAVKVSSSHIEQIFLNIMTNAQHAMSKGGTLTISTCMEDDMVKIKFQDTGVGIEPQDLGRIFDPFYTKKVNKKITGTGLGLSMAFKMIEKHQGTIAAESEGKGKGATFAISLPIAGLQKAQKPEKPQRK